MKEKLLNKRRALILLIWAISLLYSFFLHYTLGMDNNTDTANYHYYIGWASSIFSPYSFGAVAQYHTYLNPLIDVVNYITFSTNPLFGALFHSLVFSLTFVILYLISYKVLNEMSETYNTMLSIWSIIIAATGAMTVSLFGSFTNEHITALLIILAIWFSLEYIQKEKLALIFYSGLFIGFAVGLKLTATPYLLGLFFTLVLITKLKTKTIFYMFVGATLGVVITDGIFMYLRWYETGNPLFPLANNIFRSPLYPMEWMSFSKFEPNKILHYLSLPIKWIYAGDYSEMNNIRDGRIFLAYLGLIMILISIVIKKRKLTKEEVLIICFFILSWLFWILVFRIYRYLIVLELLSAILFLIGLKTLFSKILYRITAISLATIFLYMITVYPDWGRRPWEDKFVTSDIIKILPNQTSNVVVFLADDRLAFIAPELYGLNIKFANLFSQQWYGSNRAYYIPTDRLSVDISNKNIYFIQYNQVDPKGKSLYLKKLFENKKYECIQAHTNMPWPGVGRLNPFICHYSNIP